MAKKYIAVRVGQVNNTVFVCVGPNACQWYDHVWPLIEGTSRQEFKGFDSLVEAVGFIRPDKRGTSPHLVYRDEAVALIAGV